MSAGTAPALAPKFAAARKAPRYKLSVPAELTVLRSGVPDGIPGRTHEVGEGGLGVVVSSQLLPGEAVRVEFLLPHITTPVRATAVVRYKYESRFGLQFLRLSVEQRSIIRYWTRRQADVPFVTAKDHAGLPTIAPTDTTTAVAPSAAQALPSSAAEPVPPPAPAAEEVVAFTPLSSLEDYRNPSPRFTLRRVAVFAAAILIIVALLGWWRWHQGWMELEAQVPAKSAEAPTPQLQVPAEAMQQRLSHRVMPEYPDSASHAGVQGTVVLDAIVNGEGAVAKVKFVSGPEALALAAMDAVRWWRYEPYLVNGQPTTVETTVSVDFRLAN